MRKDEAAYMRYYKLERLHTTNGDQSPINYENSLKKRPVGLDQYNRTMLTALHLLVRKPMFYTAELTEDPDATH